MDRRALDLIAAMLKQVKISPAEQGAETAMSNFLHLKKCLEEAYNNLQEEELEEDAE